VIPSAEPAEILPPSEVATHLAGLPARQREVLQSIAVDQVSIKDTAKKMAMSEGAVRVALHRGLSKLAASLRKE
jgi:RNA polymerase sigma-70 factor (ECF subfamily)